MVFSINGPSIIRIFLLTRKGSKLKLIKQQRKSEGKRSLWAQRPYTCGAMASRQSSELGEYIVEHSSII